MAKEKYRVSLTETAFQDLAEIVEYWSERGEPERGEQYAEDLPSEAIRQLSEPQVAQSGRFLRRTQFPEAQEILVFKRSYRILYRLYQETGVVEVLSFWHSHRDEPFND